MADVSIFEKILAKQIPADIIYEDNDVLAFRDVQPQAPVHFLVIPKKKLVSFADLADADAQVVGLLFQKAAKIAKEQGLEEGGYRVVSNCGAGAGQSVFYLHLHVLAGRPFSWPPG